MPPRKVECHYWFRKDNPSKPHVITWPDPFDGRRRFQSFTRKKLALEWARAKERELIHGGTGGAETPWDQAVTEYVDTLLTHSVKYRYDVGRALATLRSTCRPRTLADLTPALLDRYFQRLRDGEATWEDANGELRRRTPSEVQARKDWAIFRAFAELMVNRRKLEWNPVKTVPKPRPQYREIRVPEIVDWVRLLETIPSVPDLDAQAWHVLILLAAVTGIDQADLIRLRLEHVQLGGEENGHIGLIRWSRTKRARTARRNLQYHGLPRVVNDQVASRIGSLLGDGAEMLFPWSHFQRSQWIRLQEAAGFRFTFASLRKAAGTQAAEGVALRAAADELGHSSTNVTRRHYTADSRLAQAVARAIAAELPALPPLPTYRSNAAPASGAAPRPGSAPSAGRE